MEKIRILIVEDEGLVARDIENMVKNLGYTVSAVVATGEDAIERAEQHHPDLVLMDIILRGNVDGVQAAEKIRDKLNIPVIYLTAHTDEQTLQRAKVTEPFGYSLKPIEQKELLTAIEMALYKHKMEMIIKEREAWLSTILKSIGDGVIATDREGHVTFMNPIAEQLTGHTQEESIHKPLKKIVHLENKETGKRLPLTPRKIVQDGGWSPNDSDMVLVHNGEKTPVEVSTSFIRDTREDVSGIVLVFHDITERKRQEEKLAYMAIHDSLTGLPNRTLFYDRLEVALAHAKRNRQKLALLMMDLDFFKKVNDTFGHNTGDKLLREVAIRLKALLRKGDTVARLGGDEFLLLLPEIPNVDVATDVARRILESFRTPFSFDSHRIQITFSIGISIFPHHGNEPEELTKNADLAMYRAKEEGRARFKFYAQEKQDKEEVLSE